MQIRQRKHMEIKMRNIIGQVLSGDNQAYKKVVVEYGPGIRAFFASHLDSTSQVEDLSQEVFITAFEKLSDFDMEKDFGKWLKGIARKKLLMHFRSLYTEDEAMNNLRQIIVTRMGAGSSLWKKYGFKDLVSRLKACMNRLPDKTRKIVIQKYIQNDRIAVIAEKFHMSVTAVSVALFRSRKMLKSCIRREA